MPDRIEKRPVRKLERHGVHCASTLKLVSRVPSAASWSMRGVGAPRVRYYSVQAELRSATELAEQLRDLAHRQSDAVFGLVAEHALGSARFLLGEPVTAQPHLEQSLRLYRIAQHHAFAFLGGFDPGVIAGIIGALTLWSLGYADQARHRIHAALALAHQVAHVPSLAHAALVAAILAQWCRDVPAVQMHADALMSLGAEYGFTHRLEQVRLLRGWVLAMQGEAARSSARGWRRPRVGA